MAREELPAWLRRAQLAPASIPAGGSRPTPLLFDAEHRPITSREQWDSRRSELRRLWQDFLGIIRVPPCKPELEILMEDREDGVIRRLVRYECEPGLEVEAYLLRPEEDGGERPGVAVFHSTDDATIRQPAGLSGDPDKHIGLRLARRGYVAICPKNFLWQYGRPGHLIEAVEWLGRRHPGVTGMAKMLFDASRAVDLLVAQPGVDPRRIGAIGHSLGAKEVLYLAAFDPRIRASVASEGGVGLGDSNWEAPWYLGEAIRRPGFPLDHGQVLSLTAPRAMLLIGGDSADGDRSWPYVEEALPVWRLTGRPEAVGLYNHRKGHAFPPEADEYACLWLDHFLNDRVG